MTTSWPAGVELATLIFDSPFSTAANSDIKTTAALELLLGNTKQLTWTATGQTWEPFEDTFTEPATIPIPVQQDGFTDSTGAPFTDYTFRLTIQRRTGSQLRTSIRYIAPVAGQTIIPVSSLTDTNPGTPTPGTTPAVTSVNGMTGAVTVQGGSGTNVNVYTFTSSALWSITHALGHKPLIALYDDQGNDIETDVYATNTIATATFPTPVSGTAVLI